MLYIQILVDNRDVRFINPIALRAECSLVSQEPVLFDGTISDNIRYGRLDATQVTLHPESSITKIFEFLRFRPKLTKRLERLVLGPSLRLFPKECRLALETGLNFVSIFKIYTWLVLFLLLSNNKISASSHTVPVQYRSGSRSVPLWFPLGSGFESPAKSNHSKPTRN